MSLKKKNHFFLYGQVFYPTSCMAMRRKFLETFVKYLEAKNFPNLEIDARIAMFAFY